MADDPVWKLGEYFVYFGIRERFGITFERFLQIVDNGMWEVYVA